MGTYGIWSEEAGGVLVSDLHSRQAADRALAEIAAGVGGWDVIDATDPDAVADLAVVETCDEHPESPAGSCDDCDYDEDEGD